MPNTQITSFCVNWISLLIYLLMPHGSRKNLFDISAWSLIVGSGRFFPGRGIFSSLRRPDHLWGPPSPLFNECWGISAQEYRGRGMRLPGLVQSIRTCDSIPTSPFLIRLHTAKLTFTFTILL